MSKEFSDTVKGYRSVKKVSDDLTLKDTEAKYALLPVYTFNATYGGKTYSYAVNGQTGKIIGEFPKSKLRWFSYFIRSAGIVAAVLLLLSFLLR